MPNLFSILGPIMVRSASINDSLGNDELRAVLSKLDRDKDKEVFGLVCKRWLHLQSTDRRKLCVRAGPHMLKQLAARFTGIRELNLSQSSSRSFFPGVTDSDLAVISASFSVLLVLCLDTCKGITDKGLSEIGSKLHSLQSLNVSYCRKLTDKGLSSVANGCHNLRSLHVAGCRFVTDDLLTALSINCKNLEELDLQGCTSLTDSGLKTLSEGCKHLKHLDLGKCSNIGDPGVTSISKVCSSSLLTLKLLDCYKVGDDSILSLATHCENLETLIIGGCRNISNESIKSLATGCSRNLQHLRMDWCQNVCGDSLDRILLLCKKLELLDVGCCEDVTDVAFQGLGNDGCKLNLKTLKISNCPKITLEGLSKLLKSCDDLKYLDVRSCPHVSAVRCREARLEFPRDCVINFAGSLDEPNMLR